jgi:hypothetical protein
MSVLKKGCWYATQNVWFKNFYYFRNQVLNAIAYMKGEESVNSKILKLTNRNIYEYMIRNAVTFVIRYSIRK